MYYPYIYLKRHILGQDIFVWATKLHICASNFCLQHCHTMSHIIRDVYRFFFFQYDTDLKNKLFCAIVSRQTTSKSHQRRPLWWSTETTRSCRIWTHTIYIKPFTTHYSTTHFSLSHQFMWKGPPYRPMICEKGTEITQKGPPFKMNVHILYFIRSQHASVKRYIQ